MTTQEMSELQTTMRAVVEREMNNESSQGVTLPEISQAVAAERPDLIAKYCESRNCTHAEALSDIEATVKAAFEGGPAVWLQAHMQALEELTARNQGKANKD